MVGSWEKLRGFYLRRILDSYPSVNRATQTSPIPFQRRDKISTTPSSLNSARKLPHVCLLGSAGVQGYPAISMSNARILWFPQTHINEAYLRRGTEIATDEVNHSQTLVSDNHLRHY